MIVFEIFVISMKDWYTYFKQFHKSLVSFPLFQIGTNTITYTYLRYKFRNINKLFLISTCYCNSFTKQIKQLYINCNIDVHCRNYFLFNVCQIVLTMLFKQQYLGIGKIHFNEYLHVMGELCII